MSALGPAYGVPLETSNRGNTGAKNFLQDQTAESLEVPLLKDRGTFILDGPTVIDSRFFDVQAGHSIAAGEIIELGDATTFMQARVIAVLVDNIELDSPINHIYADLSVMTRSTDDMRVNGAVTPQVFSILPVSGQAGDMVNFLLVMEATVTNMDYTGFGPLAALTNGCVLRIKRANGDFKNLFNFKSNGEFIEKSFDHSFESKTGGGGSGFVAQSAYGGQDNRGVVIRLDGDDGEELQLVIQDDLTGATLTKFRLSAQGHELWNQS